MGESKDRTVTCEAEQGQRLDLALAAASGQSRSQVERLIREGQARVEGLTVLKPGFRLKAGQWLSLRLPEPAPMDLIPEMMDLTLLYEDEDLAVVVKPCGMVVHPAAGHDQGTLVHGLLAQLSGLSGIGGAMRPGIVHRLDRDTSGLMLVAKNDRAHRLLSDAIAERRVRKIYQAVVSGAFHDESGVIEAPIARHPTDRKRMAVVEGGRWARSEWKLLRPLKGASLLEILLITGRTHQIRVHMAHRGHPVLGDALYGPKRVASGSRVGRLMLHAWRLSLDHPLTGALLTLEAPPSPDFERVVHALEMD